MSMFSTDPFGVTVPDGGCLVVPVCRIAMDWLQAKH